MQVWELRNEDVEAVVALKKKGLSRQEVASALGMSLHMVVCAEQKARRIPRRPAFFHLF
jgi:transcriptional regulator